MSYLVKKIKDKFPHIKDSEIEGVLTVLNEQGALYRVKDVHFEIYKMYKDGMSCGDIFRTNKYPYSMVHISRIIKSFRTLGE